MSSSTSNSNRYLLIVLVGGALLLTLILVGLEVFLRMQESENASNQEYRARFHEGTAPWAAFGDSHVEGGLLSVGWLDNLGQASDNLETITKKVSLRLERDGLQGVILPADPQIFSFYRLSADQSNRIDALQSDRLVRLLILDPRYRQFLNRVFWTLLKKPIHIFTTSDSDSNDEQETSDVESNWDRIIAIRVQLHTPVPNIFGLEAADQYVQMVRDLKSQGVAVCLVRYPVSHDYLRAAQELDGFANAEKFFKSVSSTLNVPHIDLSDLLPNEDFDDPDHVPESARKYVTMLLKERCSVKG